MDVPPFSFEYRPGRITYGVGAAGELSAELDRHGHDRALVVTGRTVGTSPAVMDPIRAGLGDRLAGVFAETTPEKYLATAADGVRRFRDLDADVIVAVGGGSSLDTAKVMSALAGHDRPVEDAVADIVEAGAMGVPDGDLPPVVAVPTTLAGADLSIVAGVKLTADPAGTPKREIPSGGVGDGRLMPATLVYDPALFATTPDDVLAASAMNGFDKGIEMLYSRTATPITDGTASRGLRLLAAGLPDLRGAAGEDPAMRRTVAGIINVQYGISTPTAYRASIIHAFGHGFARGYEVTQGAVHGILAPHVLRYVFGQVDARRDLIAEALGLEVTGEPDAVAEAIATAVAGLRDDLELPARLRGIDGLEENHLPEIAEAIMTDSFMTNGPADLDPDVDGIERVLRRAW